MKKNIDSKRLIINTNTRMNNKLSNLITLISSIWIKYLNTPIINNKINEKY